MSWPERIAGVLLDIDGTILESGAAIPGAAESLAGLARADIPFRLVTNTTSKPLSAIVEKLAAAGLEIPGAHIFSAPVVAREYCLQQGFTRCFPLFKQSLQEDFEGIEFVEDAPQAVLIGDLGDELNFTALNHAFRCLLDGAAFITMARNRYFQGADGLCLDVGSIVAALEFATERTAVLVGKPALEFFQPALESMGISAAQAVMIGDDLESDVGGAQAAGLGGVLVRTGKFRAEQLQNSTIQPDQTLDSLATLATLFG